MSGLDHGSSGACLERQAHDWLPETDRADDAVLAAVLIRMWSLASGRRLRDDVPPGQLTEDELIEFWADDMKPAAPGRHSAGAAPPPA